MTTSTYTEFFANNNSATGGGLYHQRVFLTSGSFTIPSAGMYLVTAIGGGGGGATVTAYGGTATGGGAGGMAQTYMQLATGVSLTIQVGAGGAGGSSTNIGGEPVFDDGTGFAGLPGGTTTVSGGGISLIANGGQGGERNIIGSYMRVSGGAASGGNRYNIYGGGSSAQLGAAWGGAPGIKGTTPVDSSNRVFRSRADDNIYGAPGIFFGGRLLQPVNLDTFNPTALIAGYGAGGTAEWTTGVPTNGGSGIVIIEWVI